MELARTPAGGGLGGVGRSTPSCGPRTTRPWKRSPSTGGVTRPTRAPGSPPSPMWTSTPRRSVGHQDRQPLWHYVMHLYSHGLQQFSEAAVLLTRGRAKSPGDIGILEFVQATWPIAYESASSRFRSSTIRPSGSWGPSSRYATDSYNFLAGLSASTLRPIRSSPSARACSSIRSRRARPTPLPR